MLRGVGSFAVPFPRFTIFSATTKISCCVSEARRLSIAVAHPRRYMLPRCKRTDMHPLSASYTFTHDEQRKGSLCCADNYVVWE